MGDDLAMGQSAKRKRQRAAAPPAAEPPAQEAVATPPRFRVSTILLFVIPVLGIALAVGSVEMLDSRPGAGIVLLLSCALWITALAVRLGRDIPRRDRLRYSGLSFGRKQ